MNVAIRYYSKTGHTKDIAEALAEGAGEMAISITDEPTLNEKVDILFLGGAPYANIMAPELREYASKLTPETVGKVVLFSTSNWSRRTMLALRKMLKNQGISVEQETFYSHFLAVKSHIEPAKEFAKRITHDEN